jgi:alanine racemase
VNTSHNVTTAATETLLRPTWADIDLSVFDQNVDAIALGLPGGSRLIAFVKADGYGHGAVELGRRCRPERVAMLATALLEESLELRRAGIELPLLCLGAVDADQVRLADDQAITLGVVGPEELADVCEVAKERDLGIHLKLDSGLGRMGVVESEIPRVIELVRSVPRLRIDALYTHLANAEDATSDLTERQLSNFERMVSTLREAGIDAPLHHTANTAATMRDLVKPGDYVRSGIALYGPSATRYHGRIIAPVMRWRTAIARLKELPAGYGIGYGATFHTTRPSRIATLPVGYADGFSRSLSNRGEVLVRGRRAPVVGRVSMDLTTIDVTDIPGSTVGDEVVLIGKEGTDEITADEMASRIGTISYEVFCGVSARVPRRFHDGSRVTSRSRFDSHA